MQNAEPIELTFQSTVKANTIEAIAAFARNGLGIAFLPDISIAQDLKTGSLARLAGLADPEPTPIYAVHSCANLPPKSVQETISSIQKALTKILE
ncbi:hypothetical protein GCM10007094_37190 [Pseudovibrio japonicus]|uniref:LysR substrate-binding domain-containing protein n=1 Tax=Pseudovibrio japonicus TaxID=366534 RepID=A0ABQ3EPS4_9HYPH|nr:LysR substrate-binding domain-containing protein [Pseudovibrio japonicus]GHB44428.1 hypothetical protein GCM10007094_37190 [Pseudovibrio japonicus]